MHVPLKDNLPFTTVTISYKGDTIDIPKILLTGWKQTRSRIRVIIAKRPDKRNQGTGASSPTLIMVVQYHFKGTSPKRIDIAR